MSTRTERARTQEQGRKIASIARIALTSVFNNANFAITRKANRQSYKCVITHPEDANRTITLEFADHNKEHYFSWLKQYPIEINVKMRKKESSFLFFFGGEEKKKSWQHEFGGKTGLLISNPYEVLQTIIENIAECAAIDLPESYRKSIQSRLEAKAKKIIERNPELSLDI